MIPNNFTGLPMEGSKVVGQLRITSKIFFYVKTKTAREFVHHVLILRYLKLNDLKMAFWPSVFFHNLNSLSNYMVKKFAPD